MNCLFFSGELAHRLTTDCGEKRSLLYPEDLILTDKKINETGYNQNIQHHIFQLRGSYTYKVNK